MNKQKMVTMVSVKTKSMAGPEDKVLGSNLKRIRIAKGISQDALSQDIAVSFQQIQKYEKGTNRIAASMLLRISNSLDVPILDFYDGLLDNKEPFLGGVSAEDLRVALMIGQLKDKDVLRLIKKLLKHGS